jgi:hypothetical protein
MRTESHNNIWPFTRVSTLPIGRCQEGLQFSLACCSNSLPGPLEAHFLACLGIIFFRPFLSVSLALGNCALSARTTFGQTQTGATVPLRAGFTT